MSAVYNGTADLHRFIVERIAVGVLTVNTRMEVIQWNRYMEMNTGRLAGDIVGRNLFESFPDLPVKWLTQKIRGVIVLKNFAFTSWQQRPYLFAFRHNRPVTGGVDFMQQDVTFLPVRDASGEVTAVSVTIFDVTDAAVAQRAATDANARLRVALAEVEHLSTRDGLTGVPNRRALTHHFEPALQRFQQTGAPLSLAMFDVDHFKRVNDTYGHLGGDAVLRGIAARVGTYIRPTDIFGRYGGEEFALVLPETVGDDAAAVGEEVRAAIAAAPIDFDGTPIQVTVSIGVTEARPATKTVSELVAEADAALYRCKAAGRNRVLRFAV